MSATRRSLNSLRKAAATPTALCGLLLVGTGVLLRVLFIHHGGLWLDEIWSMVVSGPSKSASQVISACVIDSHPPLFDLVLHLWLTLFPGVEMAGRYLSLLFGIAGIACTYYYSVQLSQSRRASAISTGIVALSFFHIYYSADVRFYALLYLLALVFTSNVYLFVRSGSMRHLSCVTVFGCLIIYTHYYGALLVFVSAVLVGILYLLKQLSARHLMYYAAACVLILVAYSPWLKPMLATRSQSSWLPMPTAATFFQYLYYYTGDNPLETAFMLVALVGFPWVYRANKTLIVVLYGTIALSFLVPFTLSHIKAPLLHQRYTMIYFPALILISGLFWAETSLVRGRWKSIIVLVVFASSIVNIAFVHPMLRTPRESWRESAADIGKYNAALQVPVYADGDFWLNYYLELNGTPRALSPAAYKGEKLFWYMRSSYDPAGVTTRLFTPTDVVERHEYPDQFALLLCDKRDKR